MVTTQGLAIVLLILCITYKTQTAPFISFPDIQSQFTQKIRESLKEVRWGCVNGTKCHDQNKLWRITLLNRGMTIPPPKKRKNRKGKKSQKAGR